jgi:uncharacterized Tic20 family protein
MIHQLGIAQTNRKAAVFAHLLFLMNITFLPIVSFIWLLVIYQKNKATADVEVLAHYHQSIVANIVSGVLLVIISGLILVVGDLQSAYTWMWLILYFTCIHSVLILLAVFAMMKANNGKPYSYPVIGKLWQ